MTKFEQMCEMYKSAQQEFRIFRDDSYECCMDLWNRMIEYYGIPSNKVSLYRIKKDGSFESVGLSMTNALFLREDSYWEFGIGVTVYESPKSYPQETILVHLLLRKEGHDKFFIKLNDEAEEFDLTRGKKETFEKFYDYLLNFINESYKIGLQSFIRQKTVRKIGFKN